MKVGPVELSKRKDGTFVVGMRSTYGVWCYRTLGATTEAEARAAVPAAVAEMVRENAGIVRREADRLLEMEASLSNEASRIELDGMPYHVETPRH